MLSKRTEIFDKELNFWELFPEMTVDPVFRELKNKDRSKGKESSSKIMWALHLAYHPKSPIYNSKNKWDSIGETVTKNIKISITEEMKEAYKAKMLSPAQRNLIELEELLDDRTQFLKEQEYSFDNFDKLDKMHAQTHLLYKRLKEALNDITEEEAKNNTQNKSLAEQGKI